MNQLSVMADAAKDSNGTVHLWSNNLFKLPYFQYRLFRFPVRPEIGYDSL